MKNVFVLAVIITGVVLFQNVSASVGDFHVLVLQQEENRFQLPDV